MDRASSPPPPSDADRGVAGDEQFLSDADKERLHHARTVFGHFSKTVKAMRLYVGKGPHVERFRADLFRELQQFLLTQGELRVDLAPDALLMFGYAVFTPAPEDGEELIYTLFGEGLREFAFEPGLTAEELATLLDVLVIDATSDDRRADDDRVTLLWKASLEHVLFRTADLFTTGAFFQRNPEYRTRYLQRVQRLLQRAAPSLAPGGMLTQPARAPATGATTEVELDPLLDAFQGFALSDALVYPDFHDGIGAVRELLAADAPRQPVRFLEVLCDTVAACPDRPERVRAVEQAERLLEDVLAANDLDTLSAIVDALRAHCQVRDETRDARQAFVADVLGPLARYHRLILLRPALTAGRREDLDKLMSFFDLLPRTELDGLVSFLVKLGDGPAARPLRELLERRGADLTPYHVARLKSENVLVVLEALRLLAASWTPKAEEAVRALLDNRNPSVRRQAMLAFKGRWDTQVFTDALRFLQADEVSLRLAALEVIAAARDPEMAEPLQTVAERPDFAKRDLDERRRHLSALVACDAERAVPWLAAQLPRRNLFARRHSQALHEAAVLALLDHDRPDTRQALSAWLSTEPANSPLRLEVEPVLLARQADVVEPRGRTP